MQAERFTILEKPTAIRWFHHGVSSSQGNWGEKIQCRDHQSAWYLFQVDHSAGEDTNQPREVYYNV